MTGNLIQKFDLIVDRADIAMGDESWVPEYVAEMNDAGFSMKGGLYIGMSVVCEEDEELGAFCYVPVARRISPIEREPTNGHEASLPDFMEYRAFPVGSSSSLNWGAAVINALIATNEGKLPNQWLESAMTELETSQQQN